MNQDNNKKALPKNVVHQKSHLKIGNGCHNSIGDNRDPDIPESDSKYGDLLVVTYKGIWCDECLD